MVTIKDISKRSGYSISTISKVMNNYPDIPEQTRNIILNLIEEMRYVPNSTARSLKTAKSYTIGIIFEEMTQQGLQHPLFSKILESFKNVVEAQGYDILFLAKNMGLQNGSYYQHSVRKQVDAVLVLCADFNSENMTELYASELPLVVIDYVEKSALTISSNNDHGIALAIEHLASLGHQKIGHIYGDIYTYIGYIRKKAFEKAMQLHQLEVLESYAEAGPKYSREDGYDAMKELLNKELPMTAVFCASDLLAIGAIEAIREAGLSVPEDISIVGFDGIDLGQMITPTLTTVKQNTTLMGQIAANKILDMVDKKQIKMREESISVMTELLVGKSTAKPKDVNK